jgi:hypothetical protein
MIKQDVLPYVLIAIVYFIIMALIFSHFIVHGFMDEGFIALCISIIPALLVRSCLRDAGLAIATFIFTFPGAFFSTIIFDRLLEAFWRHSLHTESIWLDMADSIIGAIIGIIVTIILAIKLNAQIGKTGPKPHG